jgi:hypothetical protein
MATYEGWVNTKAYCPIVDTLNDNQFSALVSFCYNCGVGSLDKLCQGRTAEQIAEAMPLYNKSGGKVLAGLVRRRAAEVELFNTPVKEVETMTKDEFKALFNECMAEYINTLASKDVSNWAKDEVAEAIELGITDGTRPGSYATREEVMLMTKRAVSK